MAYTSRTYWSTTSNPYYKTYVEPPPPTTTNEYGWQRILNASRLVVYPKKKDIEVDPAGLLDFLNG